MTDRLPGAPGRCKAVVTAEELQKMQSGNEFAITLRRDDQPILEGTPYSKAAVLPDAVAAALCPGVDDPTPGDAFGALQSQKADTVRKAYGNMITLPDAASTPLMGFKLYGKTTQNGTPTPEVSAALESSGDNGNVEVRVTGKNLLNMDATLNDVFTKDGDIYTGAFDEAGVRFGKEIDVFIPKGSTINFSAEILEANTVSGKTIQIGFIYENGIEFQLQPGMAKTQIADHVVRLKPYMNREDINCYVKFKNPQIEYGNTATEYEPYKEPQSLSVHTPNGLHSIGEYHDEIDFAKGAYVRRVNKETFDGTESFWELNLYNGIYYFWAELEKSGIAGVGACSHLAHASGLSVSILKNNDFVINGNAFINAKQGDVAFTNLEDWKAFLAEQFNNGTPLEIVYALKEPIITPLTSEQLDAYGKLHTCVPTTVITNDAGAEMEVSYYTPTTAVQMVHGPANRGKTFTIDQRGCVALTRDNPVVACGNTTLDGVTWYYRKWADGFAECWGGVSKSYDVANGVHSTLEVLLPFEIRSIHYGSSSVFLRLSNSAYQYVDIGDVHDVEGGYVEINVTVPEDALQDEFVSYSGDIYVVGYWKEPEVTV